MDSAHDDADASAQQSLGDMDPTLFLEQGTVDDTPLDPLFEAFIAEFIRDNNAVAAGRRVGISRKAVEALVKRPDVQRAVISAREQREARVGMSRDTVLHELTLLSHSNLTHYVISDTGHVVLAPGAPDGAMGAIQSIKRKVKIFSDRDGNETHREYDVEIKLWDKAGALRLIGRQLGLFPDKVQHVGADDGPIQIREVRSVIVDPKQPE